MTTPRRWARIHPEHHRGYPANYRGQWFRVLERHDPDIPMMPGYIWLELAGKAQQVQAAHLEIVERAKQRSWW